MVAIVWGMAKSRPHLLLLIKPPPLVSIAVVPATSERK